MIKVIKVYVLIAHYELHIWILKMNHCVWPSYMVVLHHHSINYSKKLFYDGFSWKKIKTVSSFKKD